jgi:hypothetical protein
MMIDESNATTSSRSSTISRHHASLTLRLRTRSERTVVEEAADAAVDLARLENETATLGERGDFLHRPYQQDARVVALPAQDDDRDRIRTVPRLHLRE